VLGDSKPIGFNRTVNKPPANPPPPVRIRKLTGPRMALAVIIAVIADGAQLLLGPAGWIVGDQVIDAITALLTGWLLGFHWLLLPTFMLELVPLAEIIPTWTGCVIAVIALRKREQRRLQSMAVPDGPS